MRNTLIKSFFLGVLIGALVYISSNIISTWMNENRKREIHSSLLTKVESLGNLELVRYRIKDIMILKKGTVPLITQSRMLAVISGEATGCIDMRKINEETLRISGDTVFVKLPDPYVCHHSLNHRETRLYDMNLSIIDRAMDREEEFTNWLYREAEDRILQEAIRSGILEETRRSATDFLERFLKSLGFSHVVFVRIK